MSTTTQTRRAGWKGWLFPAIAAGVLATSLVTLATTNAQLTDERAERAEESLALKERITELSSVREDAAASAAALAAGAPSGDLGIVLDRVAVDKGEIYKLLTVMFTWDSTDSYEMAREQLTRVYGISKDDAFVVTFLPPAPVSVDAEGTEYPYIEAAGLNSALGAFTAKPTLVHGGEYEYLVTASVQASSSDGSSTAARAVVLTLTTSADGTIIGLHGWTSLKEARTAGAA